MIFLVLFLVPALVAIGYRLIGGRYITWKEFAAHLAVQAFVAAVVALAISCQSTGDTETLNGRVTNKYSARTSCGHPYPCNCRPQCSGSGKDRSCYTVCDTCYFHPFDVNWVVDTSVGSLYIDRVDSQGLYEPQRFTTVQFGEPAALPHSYTNYIKAAPDSLFRRTGDYSQFKNLPAYPGRFYDYYRLDRLVLDGFAVPDAAAWQSDLADINATLGVKKQVNVILLVTKDKPRDWYYALEQSWLGGKKNDVVVVVSVAQDLTPQWVQVMAWTDRELLRVRLRDDLMAAGALDRGTVVPIIAADVSELYVRKPMKDFEYLQSSFTPSPLQWTIALLISLIVAFGFGQFVLKEDVFGDER